jgi:hypothetical protein
MGEKEILAWYMRNCTYDQVIVSWQAHYVTAPQNKNKERYQFQCLFDWRSCANKTLAVTNYLPSFARTKAQDSQRYMQRSNSATWQLQVSVACYHRQQQTFHAL